MDQGNIGGTRVTNHAESVNSARTGPAPGRTEPGAAQ